MEIIIYSTSLVGTAGRVGAFLANAVGFRRRLGISAVSFLRSCARLRPSQLPPWSLYPLLPASLASAVRFQVVASGSIASIALFFLDRRRSGMSLVLLRDNIPKLRSSLGLLKGFWSTLYPFRQIRCNRTGCLAEEHILSSLLELLLSAESADRSIVLTVVLGRKDGWRSDCELYLVEKVSVLKQAIRSRF